MSEPGNFEHEWKGVFDGAELAPPAKVWSDVRAEIAADQIRKQSGQVTYWRWMAAASIVLMLGVGIGSYYYSQETIREFQTLATQEQNLLRDIALLEKEQCAPETASLFADQAEVSSEVNENMATDEMHIAALVNASGKENTAAQDENVKAATISVSGSDEKLALAPAVVSDADNTFVDVAITDSTPLVDKDQSAIAVRNSLPTVASDDHSVANTAMVNAPRGPEVVASLGVDRLAEMKPAIQPRRVPDMMEIIKMQQGVKEDLRTMWAGLSVGGGSFASNIGSTESALALSDGLVEGVTVDGLNARDVNLASTETPAFSYAISADFGKNIGRKTFVQGGVEYSRYASSATSSLANNGSEAFLRYTNTDALVGAALTPTASYDLSNSFEYIAIPVKLGYQVLNRKIGIALSSGVSTNFFLKNTLKDKSGARNEVEVTNGASSPYKPLNFNGLVGAEISYQWNAHYQLAIVPDYRISLDGVTKTDAFIQNKPTAFFLGFRFKYILK